MSETDPAFCGFCGAPLTDAEYEWVRDPWDGEVKFVCADSDACAARGRAPWIAAGE